MTDLSHTKGVERLSVFIAYAYVGDDGQKDIEILFVGIGGVSGKTQAEIATEVADRLVDVFGAWILEHIVGWCGDNAAVTELNEIVAQIVQRGYNPIRKPTSVPDDLHNQSLCWEAGSEAGFGSEQGVGSPSKGCPPSRPPWGGAKDS